MLGTFKVNRTESKYEFLNILYPGAEWYQIYLSDHINLDCMAFSLLSLLIAELSLSAPTAHAQACCDISCQGLPPQWCRQSRPWVLLRDASFLSTQLLIEMHLPWVPGSLGFSSPSKGQNNLSNKISGFFSSWILERGSTISGTQKKSGEPSWRGIEEAFYHLPSFLLTTTVQLTTPNSVA